MRFALPALALVLAYALWWITPRLQDLIGLGWAGDFGQICLVILTISVIGRIGERFLP